MRKKDNSTPQETHNATDSPKTILKLTYTCPGRPVSLKRARIISADKCWNSQKKEQLVWGIHIKNQHGTNRLFEGPLHLEAVFYFPKPNYKSPSALWDIPYYTPKPDLDNLLKWLCDVCSNNVLFKDDAIIVSIASAKLYSPEPKTVFTITELHGR